jgi:hypothetical protein
MNKSDLNRIKKILPRLSSFEKNQIKMIQDRGDSNIPPFYEFGNKSIHVSNISIPFEVKHPRRFSEK